MEKKSEIGMRKKAISRGAAERYKSKMGDVADQAQGHLKHSLKP